MALSSQTSLHVHLPKVQTSLMINYYIIHQTNNIFRILGYLIKYSFERDIVTKKHNHVHMSNLGWVCLAIYDFRLRFLICFCFLVLLLHICILFFCGWLDLNCQPNQTNLHPSELLYLDLYPSVIVYAHFLHLGLG